MTYNFNLFNKPNHLTVNYFKFKSRARKWCLGATATGDIEILPKLDAVGSIAANGFRTIDSRYDNRPAIYLDQRFQTFQKFKVNQTPVYVVPFNYDRFRHNIVGSVVDLDFFKIVIDSGSPNQTFQFVKRNMYLKGCHAQYGLVDETAHWAQVETSTGIKTFEKVYLFSYDHPREEVPDRLNPLVDLNGNNFCVRPSYTQEPLTIHPVDWMTYNDISQNLLYNVDYDKLCDIDHQAYYEAEWPDMFSMSLEDQADLDDDWEY